MTAQVLDRVLKCYRIGDPDGRYPVFDATGSTRYPGRWNTSTSPMIYTSEHYSTAMLEKLVHGSGCLPPNQHYVEITIPNGVSFETVTSDTLPGWDNADCGISQLYGEQWQRNSHSLLLIVPSLVARIERNILINSAHADFHRITYGMAIPVCWDSRLYGNPLK